MSLIVGVLLPEREVMRVLLEDAERAGDCSAFRAPRGISSMRALGAGSL
jgi:hypothetical protein